MIELEITCVACANIPSFMLWGNKSSVPCGNLPYCMSDWDIFLCSPLFLRPAVVTKYQNRIFGTLLDRIDINIEVPRVDNEKLSSDRVGETSNSIR